MRVLVFVLAVSLSFVVGALTTAHCPWVKEVLNLDGCKCCPCKGGGVCTDKDKCCPKGVCPK